MPIYAATRGQTFDGVLATLEELVRNFESDSAGNRKLIRDIFDDNRELFYRASIEILKKQGDTRGTNHLVALIVANGLIVRGLCDPSLDKEQAIALGRAAVRADPLMDATLARTLADSAMGQGETVSDPARVMEILAQVADPSRVLPSLMRLLRHPNPYLRSKVVKLIGRGSRSVKWVKGRLNESDPRVRANAVEALWGVDSPEARALLHYAATDSNNRVLGNALLGLYYLGETSVLEDLVKMSEHESNLFRATAAWVMGETGDPRFCDAARHLLLEPDAIVRKRALAALARVRQVSSQPPEGARLYIAGRVLGGPRLNGMRHVMVAVAADGAKEPPKVAPIQFMLSENGRYVISHNVTEKPEPEALSVIFVVPRNTGADFQALVQGALGALHLKRPSDLWCVIPYLESGYSGITGDTQEMEAPQFSANADTIAAWFGERPKRIDCTDLWAALWRATRGDLATRGKRHIIVLSRAPEQRIADDGLIHNVQSGRFPIDVISSVENPELSGFCLRTRGRFLQCDEDEIPELIRGTCLATQARYEITYRPVDADATMLTVRIQLEDRRGEGLIQLSAPTGESG